MPIIFNILLTGRVLSLDVADSFTGANMSRPIFGEVCPDTVPLTCIAHFRLEWPENIFWVVCSTPACLTQDDAVDICQNVHAFKTQHDQHIYSFSQQSATEAQSIISNIPLLGLNCTTSQC